LKSNGFKERSMRRIFFFILFCISIFLTLQIHRDTGRFNWHSEIYSDGAGYYMYLPVTFLYRFDYDRFPAGIEDSTACSFVDHQNKKFVYKYTCGVALMVSPFFAGTVLVSKLAGLPLEGGFSAAFHRMADVAAVFYLVLGLFFTGLVLKRYVNPPVRYLVLLTLFAGTNLYFYTMRQPLMSHVYSFCIIGLFAYVFHLYLERPVRTTFLLVAFAGSLAMLIRPVNGVVLLLLLFWDTGSIQAVKDRLHLLFTRKNVLVFLAVLILVFMPQMLYWQYMFGTPVHYAYEGETFSNWAAPHFAGIWFAPLNGLFLYNPVWLFLIVGVLIMIVRKEKNGILLLLFFLLISYIVASWHSWFFGCGYGHRAFIDFLPLFAIPFGVAAEKIFRIRTRIPAVLMILVLAGMSYYNLKLLYSYSGCFFGGVWDWNRYSRELMWAGFYKQQPRVFHFTNDFENGAASQGDHYTNSTARSYSNSILFDDWRRDGCTKTFYFYEFAQPPPSHADVRIFFKSPTGKTGGARISCTIEHKGRTLWRDTCLIDPFMKKAGTWCEVRHTFDFPPGMTWDATITVQVNSPGRAPFYADDQAISFY
jgi:hypothetical protein